MIGTRRRLPYDDLQLPVLVAIGMATMYSAWVVVAAVLGGGRNVERAGTSLAAIVGAYYAAGLK